MQTERISNQLDFEGFDGRRVVAAFDGGAMSTDAGALLLRHADQALGLFERVASCFSDHRSEDRVVHGLPALVGQRIAVSVRRILVSMASAHPWQTEFALAHERIRAAAR